MPPRRAMVKLRLDQGEVDLHYRVVGRGPALLMLHPSPLNSSFMAPHMLRFADMVTAIAPDSPGYGRSTAPPGDTCDLSPYVEVMQRFCDALGLDQYTVYGSATGAQIAIELAKADEARVAGVILDNAADFTDAECEQIMEGYFPDMTPLADGSHLARAWQVAHDSTMFFPWHARWEAIEASFPRVLGQASLDSEDLLLAGGPTAYVDTSFGQVRYKRLDPWASRIVLHAPGASIDSMQRGDTSAHEIWMDSPGHGESDCPDEPDQDRYLDACAEAVMQVARGCGLADFQIAGQASSARLASLLGQRGCGTGEPYRYDTRPSEDLPPLTSELGGEHLWRGWHWLRRQHFACIDTVPEPSVLTRMLLDLIRSDCAHRKLHGLLEQQP